MTTMIACSQSSGPAGRTCSAARRRPSATTCSRRSAGPRWTVCRTCAARRTARTCAGRPRSRCCRSSAACPSARRPARSRRRRPGSRRCRSSAACRPARRPRRSAATGVRPAGPTDVARVRAPFHERPHRSRARRPTPPVRTAARRPGDRRADSFQTASGPGRRSPWLF